MEDLYNSPDENLSNNQFNLSLNGYEGPIDLLLDLAKKQQVNLSEISILDLAEQYLIFINKYKDLHLEIAADYLVMASWLTYLKSRLLLPRENKKDEFTPDELEAALKYQLQRLEAMQNVSKILISRPIIGRDTFYRGLINEIKTKYQITYTSTLYDLLKSYSSIIQKTNVQSLTISSTELFSVEQAIERLKNIFGSINEWTNFINIIPNLNENSLINKSIISSTFVASLELAKNGFLEVKQKEIFGNIFIRAKQ
tara:strand:- start:5067 stop:5831 length:765 start_codon:yes stop_codon:yes gene_type:complete